MLLSKKKRKEYLEYLGFKDIKTLQKKYFKRNSDIDGLYGKNTDILLRNAYNVKTHTKNFKLEEFRCKCYGLCTGYPAVLDTNILDYIQEERDLNGSTTINSGLRCTKHNANIGGIKKSKHLSGKAIDFINAKVCKNMTTLKAYINNYIGKKYANYSYTNGYGRTKKKTSYPECKGMNKIVHIDVK